MQFKQYLDEILRRRQAELNSKFAKSVKEKSKNFPTKEEDMDALIENTLSKRTRNWDVLEKALEEPYLKVATNYQGLSDNVLNEALDKAVYSIVLQTGFEDKKIRTKLFNLIRRSVTYTSSKRRCLQFLRQVRGNIFDFCDSCGKENEEDWIICEHCERENKFLV